MKIYLVLHESGRVIHITEDHLQALSLCEKLIDVLKFNYHVIEREIQI